MSRQTILLGSLRGANSREAMDHAWKHAGESLRWMPDGETGERSQWIAHHIDNLRHHPDLELVRDGDLSDYDKLPQYRVRNGHQLTGDSLDFGYAEHYRANKPIFDELRAQHGGNVGFQVGVTSGLNYAMLAMGPKGFPQAKVFSQAVVRDIHAIHADAGDDVLFLLELPVETLMGVQTGPLGAPLTSRIAARMLRNIVASTPAGARFGLHLCVGDFHHKAMRTPRALGPIIAAANNITKAWPAEQKLEYVHLPLAAGDQPPPLNLDFYRPLSKLNLPANVDVVAGFLHEDHSLGQLRTILDTVDTATGRTAHVAAACGLGRRTDDGATTVLDLAAELCRS